MRSKTASENLEVMRGHFLFRHFSEHELDALIAHARKVSYKSGTPIYLKGTPGSSMMAVLDGTVRISVVGPDGREIVLASIGPGDMVGEVAFLDGGERSADASAATDCEVLVVERRDYLPLLEQNPKVTIRLMAALCQRLRRTSEQVEDLALLSLPERLAKKLLGLAATKGVRTAEGIRIPGRLMQGELGNMLGTSRESINKQLGIWQRAGVLQIGKDGVFTIRNDAALHDLVDSHI